MGLAGGVEIPTGLVRTPILGEGDSYMSIAGNGAELLGQLQASTGFIRDINSTAVGGSTITDIFNRIAAEMALIAGKVMVIWDGDPNGYGSVAAYLAVIDQILALTGTTNLVMVRPGVRGPSADGTVSQLTLDMESVMAGLISRGVAAIDPVPIINTLATGTAQDLLDIQARVICASQLQGDLTHLLTPPKQLMAKYIAQKLVQKGI